ncbi:hypothetical protein AB5J62_31785 [Amycolatopsis sp. cg5]|uniref:hypothetical protein n=1 Tax=Amycolatopsis sp. cg5 TaxID=3238802 RepID=UPI003523E9CE
MKIWTELPTATDVEAAIRHYFELLQAEKFTEAEQFVYWSSVRHVVSKLWEGSVYADGVVDGEDGGVDYDDWEKDLSWLRELALAKFVWNGDHGAYVEIGYHARTLEVALSFRVVHTDDGWVLAGPATLW